METANDTPIIPGELIDLREKHRRTRAQSDPMSPHETMGTHDAITSWLGTLAYKNPGLTENDFLALLTAALADGRIVSENPREPWTSKNIEQLARDAAKWASQDTLVELALKAKSHRRSTTAKTAADYEPMAIAWLWYGRLAKGKLTVTDGNPGVGKSARQVDTAATLSTGRNWPDSPNALGPVNVGIISAEDDTADTIVPRLIAAGADLSRVFLYTGPLVIPDEMEEFEDWISTNKLVWIGLDPLVAFVSEKNDLNHDQKTRKALAPLQEILQRNMCALEGLRHTNKVQNVASAMDKGSGSRAIGGAARVNMFVARDPKDPLSIVLASAKGNNTVSPKSLTYRLDSSNVWVTDPETGAPVLMSVPIVVWTGTTDLSADDLLKIERAPNRTEEAINFLEATLTTTPMPVATLERMASGMGISVEGALKTARKKMQEQGEIYLRQQADDSVMGHSWYISLAPKTGRTWVEPEAPILSTADPQQAKIDAIMATIPPDEGN